MFEELISKWKCRPIPNCPGRHLVVGCPSRMSPHELLGGRVPIACYGVATARDPVFVAVFNGGGLISYQRPDGTFVHTLNDRAGFRRKLEELGIKVEAGNEEEEISPDHDGGRGGRL